MLRGRVRELEAQLKAANIETPKEETRTPFGSDESSPSLASYNSDGVQLDTTTTISSSAANTQFYGPSSTYYFIHCISTHLKARDPHLQEPQTLIPNSASRSMAHAMCTPDIESEKPPLPCHDRMTTATSGLTESTLSGKNLSATQEAYFLDLFWDSWHCCYQLLDEQEFKSLYKSLWSDAIGSTRKPSALVDIVIALCMQFGVTSLPRQSNSVAEIDIHDATIAGRWLYHRCQKLMAYNLESPTIETLQCQLWSAVYLANASYQNMAQNMLGVAARTAYTLGLHIPPGDDLSTKQREARKRAWCILFLLETRSCIRLGRPWVTQTQSIFPFLPEGDKTSSGVAQLNYMKERTKLTEIVRSAFNEALHHKFFDIDHLADGQARVIANGMDNMRTWAASLPSTLKTERRGDGKPLSTDLSEIEIEPFAPIWLRRQRLMLELFYHELMLTTGRSCINQSLIRTDCRVAPSAEVLKVAEACAMHAAATTQLLYQAYKQYDILDGWYEPFNCQWNAAITLVGFLMSYHNDGPVASVARKALSQGVEVLERMGDFFGAAASAALVIKTLHQTISIPRIQNPPAPKACHDDSIDPPMQATVYDMNNFDEAETLGLTAHDFLGTFGTVSEIEQLGLGTELKFLLAEDTMGFYDSTDMDLWNGQADGMGILE
ncbi:putative transcriptional regulatory protein C16G5.16 [Fusarium austroafricanum]|uniref:Putative transcriptional regulatory protein C16G5.16 n=1 Tax=Fusarium austroafricanum TaxID=2364996 RepID=A0A8H4NRY4_9HYPO|nr:putative transcriptional regulatory protein C16G5.16 [Fusarium austroafricanum]